MTEGTVFASKPGPTAGMISRFLDAGQHMGRVAGDEVTADAGKFRADGLAVEVPKRAWPKLSAGTGTTQPRPPRRTATGIRPGRSTADA